MKKGFYISSFIFLGLLVQLLIHAALEEGYIFLLTSDFETYSLGLSWYGLKTVHAVFTALLIICGIGVGFWQGRYWWRKIYEKSSNI